MSRFSNLEFGEQSDQPSRQEARIKDEAYYLEAAQAAYESGRFEAGLRAYARALEQNPDSAAAWAGQVRMLIELGEFREARLWADKAMERFPSEPELLAGKAVALARSGDLGGAMAFSDAAIEERGNSPYVWLARGDVLLARKEPRAESCFERAIALAPGNWFFLWLASRIHAAYGQFASALRLAQQALELNALKAVLWLQLGQCQFALGLAGIARQSFAEARQLDPECEGLAAAIGTAQHAGLGHRVRGFFRQLFRS
jgi:tetratricopeptide (TPR) repeat protein